MLPIPTAHRFLDKTIMGSFPTPFALREAKHEVAEFHRFQKSSAHSRKRSVDHFHFRWSCNEEAVWTGKTPDVLHQEVAFGNFFWPISAV